MVTLVAGRRLAILSGVKLNPAALLHLVRYLAYFIKALILANLDMARRVLSPSLPLRPAVVEVETHLQSPLGKLLLANSITLTPGTLSVDVQDERILVHWVDCPPGTDLSRATRTIAASFERHISGFLQ
jgi:multicomponent Na+:H+ antiporter subunit E